MDIDALHSALVSLTLLPEQLRTAREEIVSAGNQAPPGLDEFLGNVECDLRIAKATLARALGFGVCQCCWPPEMLTANHAGQMECSSISDARPIPDPAIGAAASEPAQIPQARPRLHPITPRMDSAHGRKGGAVPPSRAPALR